MIGDMSYLEASFVSLVAVLFYFVVCLLVSLIYGDRDDRDTKEKM